MGYVFIFFKIEEIKRVIDEGAFEIDVVINICVVKFGNWNYVINDIDSLIIVIYFKGK